MDTRTDDQGATAIWGKYLCGWIVLWFVILEGYDLQQRYVQGNGQRERLFVRAVILVLALILAWFCGRAAVLRTLRTVNAAQQRVQIYSLLLAIPCAGALYQFFNAFAPLFVRSDALSFNWLLIWCALSILLLALYYFVALNDVAVSSETVSLRAANHVWACQVQVELRFRASPAQYHQLKLIGKRIQERESELRRIMDELSRDLLKGQHQLYKTYDRLRNQLVPELVTDNLIGFAATLEERRGELVEEIRNRVAAMCQQIAAAETHASAIGQNKPVEINVLAPTLDFSDELQEHRNEALQRRHEMLEQQSKLGAEDVREVFRLVKLGWFSMPDALGYFTGQQMIAGELLRDLQNRSINEDEAFRRYQNAAQPASFPRGQTWPSGAMPAAPSAASSQNHSNSSPSPADRQFARDLVAALGLDRPLDHFRLIGDVYEFLRINRYQVIWQQQPQDHSEAAQVLVNWLRQRYPAQTLTEPMIIAFLEQTGISVWR